MRTVPMFDSPDVHTRRSIASPAVHTWPSALADQLGRKYLGTRQFSSRALTVQHDEHHPCWQAAHFLPCTRPPDVDLLKLRSYFIKARPALRLDVQAFYDRVAHTLCPGKEITYCDTQVFCHLVRFSCRIHSSALALKNAQERYPIFRPLCLSCFFLLGLDQNFFSIPDGLRQFLFGDHNPFYSM
jgi:hypothetical protein